MVVVAVAVCATVVTVAAHGPRVAVAADADALGGAAVGGAASPPAAQPARQSFDRVNAVTPRSGGLLGPRFPSRAPVLLVGDSLAVGIAGPLAAAWPNRTVTVEALEGRNTSTSAALLADHASATGPIWVVSLGTNDLPTDFPAAARTMMRLAGPSRCVVWYDVHRVDTQDAVNATLSRLAGRHANLHLLGWAALAQAHPEWFGYDGIHPDTAGYLARASLATDAVAQLCTTGGAGGALG